MPLSDELLGTLRREFALEWNGIHGAPHWMRVRDNGLRLAELTKADPRVVELFAFLHDVSRRNNGRDPNHGRRAAEFTRGIRHLIELPDPDFEFLVLACEKHSDGLTEADITIQTCWDADRLDLGRVGIKPEARYLCTMAAKDPVIMGWAQDLSRQTIYRQSGVRPRKDW